MKKPKYFLSLSVIFSFFLFVAVVSQATPAEDLALRRKLREKCNGMQFSSPTAKSRCLKNADSADLSEAKAQMKAEERKKTMDDVNEGIDTVRSITSLFGF